MRVRGVPRHARAPPRPPLLPLLLPLLALLPPASRATSGDAAALAAACAPYLRARAQANDTRCHLPCSSFAVTLPLDIHGRALAAPDGVTIVGTALGFPLRVRYDFAEMTSDGEHTYVTVREDAASRVVPPFIEAFFPGTCVDSAQPVARYRYRFGGGCKAVTFAPVGEDLCGMRLFVLAGAGPLAITAADGGAHAERGGADCVPFARVATLDPTLDGKVADVCADVFPPGYRHFLPHTVSARELHSRTRLLKILLDAMVAAGAFSEQFSGSLGRACATSWLADLCDSTFRPCTAPVASLADVPPPCEARCQANVEDCLLRPKEANAVSVMTDYLGARVALLAGGDVGKAGQAVCMAYDAEIVRAFDRAAGGGRGAYGAAPPGCAPGVPPNFTYAGSLAPVCRSYRVLPDLIKLPPPGESLGERLNWQVLSGCALTCPSPAYGLPGEGGRQATARRVAEVGSVLSIIALVLVIATFAVLGRAKLTHPRTNVLYMAVCALGYVVCGPIATWAQGWERATCRNEFYENAFVDGGPCVFTAFITYYLWQAIIVWWTLHAVDLYAIEVRKVDLSQVRWSEPAHHALAWGVPAVFALTALGNQEFGFSETGHEVWCTFGGGGMKEAFAGKQASLTLDDTVAKFCDKVGGAERISKLAGYKYALGVPCLFVGAALTLAVLRVAVLGDYVASQDDVDHRARELAKGAGAHAPPATASSALPANLGAGDAPATPPQDAVSGRITLQTDEQMERAERFDILGSRRYAQLSAVFGALWKRRENYYAKFAFLSILWVSLTTELALEIDRDVGLFDACETLVKEIFAIQTLDMTKMESREISFTLMNANANFFRIALLSGFGVLIFLATFFASENRVLFAELLQGTGPGTAAASAELAA